MTPAVDTARDSGIEFRLHEYEHDAADRAFGMEAVAKLGLPPAQVFKTLVVATESGDFAVGIAPVNAQLSMKAMARALGCKKVRMAPGDDVERVTGYVLGGVSPLGQRRSLRTVIDQSARAFAEIYVSGGRRGLEISLAPPDLAAVTGGEFAPIAAWPEPGSPT